MLKVGDTVMWRGSFGQDVAKPAKVTEIEVVNNPGEKYGESVNEIDWFKKSYIIVTLDNGHWARGHQISKYV